MKHWILALLPSCAIGVVVNDITIKGEQVNSSMVHQINDFVAASGDPNTLLPPMPINITFVPHPIPCAEAGHAFCYGITYFNPTSYDVYVFKHDDCLANTSLAHELIHVYYGDSNHENKDLWEKRLPHIQQTFRMAECPEKALKD